MNSREVGSGGDLPAFRNFANPHHVEEIAKLWNVDPAKLPNWGPPTHALQIFDYVRDGSIKVLWIVGTNPAWLLARIRAAAPQTLVVPTKGQGS